MIFMGKSAPGAIRPSTRSAGSTADPERWVDEHGDFLYRYALIRVRKLGRETSFTDLQFLEDEYSENFVPEGWWVHVKGPKQWKPEADAAIHRDESWQRMRTCLGKLPQRVADVFMLREMEEVESKEICRMLSISENNAK